LADPHTAVALYSSDEYIKKSDDNKKVIVVSTASPYKFSDSVLSSLSEKIPTDEFEALEKLHNISGLEIPINLYSLKNSEKRFNKIIEKEQIPERVLEFSKDISCG
jgi:threonine synthase